MTKKILLSILALVLVACLLLSAAAITGVFWLTKKVTTSADTAVIATVQNSEGSGAEGITATPMPTSAGDSNIPADIASQMDQIQKEVLSYRGLELTQPLKRALMTPEELQDQVLNEFFKDYSDEDAQKDTEILSALGLLAPDFKLRQFYIDLYSEQVAGYYDDQTKDMYVISGEGFTGTERMTYAHEFTHVLQDQTYDLENGLKSNEEYCKNETEYCAAVQALIEGDATLSEYFWLAKYSTDQDKQDITNFQQTYTSPVYDKAPGYMKQDFLFPYSQGYDFVNYLYTRNKWQSIDDAFKNPPVSTEQILHPAKYPTDKPVKVDVPDLLPVLGDGWQQDESNVMGEWYTYLILAYGRDSSFQLPETDAKDASAGWGGDTYAYYSDPTSGEFALVWRTLWDSNNDAGQFWTASQTYGSDRWGQSTSSTEDAIQWKTQHDGYVRMQRDGKYVLWTMSPSMKVQQEILTSLESAK
ncbi:MAG: hypothetical protein VB013_13485 [Anaerolineaceae bacterium]|nr:hypothetical protein [Anaerolineaceae bacterium]